MTDTHTHLYIPGDFPGQEAEQAVTRALEAGVHTIVMPNVDTESIAPLMELRSRFPQNVYAAMGLHPTEVKDSWREDLRVIASHLDDDGVIALGEIGMDLYWDTAMETAQAEAFALQLGWAAERGLPVIIHQRGALEQTLRVLGESDTGLIPGIVFHCFTEGPESVHRIREQLPEAFFGIGGVSTFKNAPALRQALHEIGPGHIVLETDAPWLAPVPHRGTRNESAYIPCILQAIATELAIDPALLETMTDRNARRLFPALLSSCRRDTDAPGPK